MSIEFNNDQIYALYKLEDWYNSQDKQVFNLSGAAGTGKTTLIRYLIERLGLEQDEVAFVAYMGKAAMQMCRNGLRAQTIHSLIYDFDKEIEIDEEGHMVLTKSGKPKFKFVFRLKERLPKDYKLIVVDEASMVNREMAKDLLSFDIPIIALGDLNQLPPVFGKPFFLEEPDYILTQVMRQSEDNPIIYLAHQILERKPLKCNIYGNTLAIIPKSSMTPLNLKQADIVLTCTNSLRGMVNDTFRQQILSLPRLDFPNVGEKIICRKNNWTEHIMNKSIFLTNGISGTIEHCDMESFDTTRSSIDIDFKPDFLDKSFKNLRIDYDRLFAKLGGEIDPSPQFGPVKNQFEFAYAITVHLSQGSQYPNVLFMLEDFGCDAETYKKLQYTAVTRASKRLTVVI